MLLVFLVLLVLFLLIHGTMGRKSQFNQHSTIIARPSYLSSLSSPADKLEGRQEQISSKTWHLSPSLNVTILGMKYQGSQWCPKNIKWSSGHHQTLLPCRTFHVSLCRLCLSSRPELSTVWTFKGHHQNDLNQIFPPFMTQKKKHHSFFDLRWQVWQEPDFSFFSILISA